MCREHCRCSLRLRCDGAVPPQAGSPRMRVWQVGGTVEELWLRMMYPAVAPEESEHDVARCVPARTVCLCPPGSRSRSDATEEGFGWFSFECQLVYACEKCTTSSVDNERMRAR